MSWQWVAFWSVLGLALLAGLALFVGYRLLLWRYLDYVVRIFQERPFFIIPRGQPIADAEDVRIPTAGGLTLAGCYLRTAVVPRRGVILFGLEFGSNRWACVPYCQFLRDAGYDVFAFEPRSQGDSDHQPGYEPMQWVTTYEVEDTDAALAYLKARPDADPRGVGLFGISKGGSAGLLAAAHDEYVRCFVTDGIFATHTTMIPFMRKWISIYIKRRRARKLLPVWLYAAVARSGLRRVRRERGVRFPHLEHAMARLGRRPLLMIHGGADNYILPEMARALYERVRGPKELWMVEGAKHNQAFHMAQDEYHRRLREFFDAHLASAAGAPSPSVEQPAVARPAAAPAERPVNSF